MQQVVGRTQLSGGGGGWGEWAWFFNLRTLVVVVVGGDDGRDTTWWWWWWGDWAGFLFNLCTTETYPPLVLNWSRRDLTPLRGSDLGPSTEPVFLRN